jgi:hypothetical protein
MDTSHEYTREAVCPNCKHELSDSWEFGDIDEYQCDCGCVFGIVRNVEVTYSTWIERMED